MKLPIATVLKTRDGTTTKDALVTNGYLEVVGEDVLAYKRAGLAAPFVSLGVAALRGAKTWLGRAYVALGSSLKQLGSGGLEQSYTITGADQVSFTNTGVAVVGYLAFKDTAKLWVLTSGNPGTLTQVTDAQYPATTVPGIAYLDGTFYVMDSQGQIFGSELQDPTSWTALNAIVAETESDAAVALAKHMNYVVAFKEKTIELFYDAANASGSPLDRVTSAALRLGCANGYSLADVDGDLYFLSRTQSKQPSVHVFPTGSQTPVEIATPDVQRVLANLAFATVYAWAARIDGHGFYVLDLKSDGMTLVYDITSKVWSRWTQLTVQAPQSAAIVQSNGVATVTATGHGFADGDPVTLAGANQSAYNGLKNAKYASANTFTFEVDPATVTPATGTITATGYTTGRFPAGAFVEYQGKNYIFGDSNGVVSEITSTAPTDNGVPIDVHIRTPKFDGSSVSRYKSGAGLTFIADRVAGDLLVRYTDDDYQTYSKYRHVPLDVVRPNLSRMGNFFRRAFDMRYTAPTRMRISAIDLDMKG
jgi:hypothetical protein